MCIASATTAVEVYVAGGLGTLSTCISCLMAWTRVDFEDDTLMLLIIIKQRCCFFAELMVPIVLNNVNCTTTCNNLCEL